MENIIFPDLQQIAENPEDIKSVPTENYWYAMNYETGDIKGKMLVAGETFDPPILTLLPKLKGWYRIYIALIRPDEVSRLYIKLSSDEEFTSISSPKEYPPINWQPYEYAQEVLWKCADMTDEKIMLSKPPKETSTYTWLPWLRFEKMNERETKEYKEYVGSLKNKNAHYHYDGNENGKECLSSPESVLRRYITLKDSDADICSLEITFDYDVPDYENTVTFTKFVKLFADYDKKHRENKEIYYKKKIDFLHKYNIEALAAYRMSLSSFGGDEMGRGGINFADEHPEYYCKTRDGRTFETCSYVYSEVQDYAINVFKEALKYGFDGVSLILQRGLLIHFEEPVIMRFKEKYPDIDPCRLPISDERLNSVWCEFVTEFMRKLRLELDKFMGRHVKINVIVGFDPNTLKHIGLDVEKWAEMGYIDCICQDTMEVYENIDDCMDGEFIDLEKYINKRKVTETLKRKFSYDKERIVNGAKAFNCIAEKYKVKFYGAIFAWPSSTEMILENQKLLKEIGVNNISVFNFVHSSIHLPFRHALANICHDKINKEYCRINNVRMFKIGDIDISTCNPNWRG